MTTTTSTDLAAKARAAHLEADRLQTQADAAEQAREARVSAALTDVAQWRYGTRTPEIAQARDAADQQWAATAADDESTLEQLWQAFASVKTTSALHFAAARANAGEADRRLGMTTTHGFGNTTQDRPRPHPRDDAWALITFSDALAQVIGSRAQATIAAESLKVDTRTAQAQAKAEQG